MEDLGFVAAIALVSEVLTKKCLLTLYKTQLFVAFLYSKGSAHSKNQVMKIWRGFGFIHTKVTGSFHMAITMQPS